MLKRALLAVGVLALVGCGGADELSEAESQAAWEATQSALGDQSNPGALTVTTSAPCDDGGTLKWKANLNDAFGLGSHDSSEFTFDYDLKFNKCATGGVKISGKLNYTLSTRTTPSGSELTWGYNGKLRYSGDIEGTCNIDMIGKYGVSETSFSMEYSGTICGNDASAALNVNVADDDFSVTNNIDGDPIDG